MKNETIVGFALVVLFLFSAFTMSVSAYAKADFAGSGAPMLPLKPYVAFMHAAMGDSRFVGLDALPVASYDEQLGLTFTQNFSSIVYNVTAVEQNDTYGYGPAYLLNGLTDKGYWYQVGLSFDWPSTNGSYAAGFYFNYEVFDNHGNSIFPVSGGGGLDSFNGTVNNHDNVLLNLYFLGGNVVMYAHDWNTNASAEETYTAVSASLFQGQTRTWTDVNGFFTGLMTEWWHANPYYGGETQVVYNDANFALSSGWLWADEWVPSNGTALFSSGQYVSFSNPTQLQNFTTNGAVEAASGYLFITGAAQLSLSASISPSSAIIDVGQQQLFNSSVTGGTSPYTYRWYLDGTVVSGATNVTWTFTPASSGYYTVYLNVTDSVGAQATSNIVNITVNIHDVAVTSVTSYKTVVGQGYGLNVTVTAADVGNVAETFNVTVYANTTSIASQNVTLSSGDSTNITVTWNTTGFAYGNYAIIAYAWPVPGETNLSNNNCTGGNVIVTIPGDVDGNGYVNMGDIVSILLAFGSTPGMPNYNANCDVDNNGKVDMGDVVIALLYFGQHYTIDPFLQG
jgi:hypothetical protein